MNPEIEALHERLRIGNLAPHAMTLSQFIERACAIPVDSDPSIWEISHGRYLSWAKGDTADEAKASIHRSEVELALKQNLPESAGLTYRLSLPSLEVLADYPDLRSMYDGIVPVRT